MQMLHTPTRCAKTSIRITLVVNSLCDAHRTGKPTNGKSGVFDQLSGETGGDSRN